MEKLLQATKDAAEGEGAIELMLYVHEQNERAIRAYRKSGFSDSDYRIMIMNNQKNSSKES
jgi:ribosomal protein S18 acetylase RimI-like enzyme